MARAKKAAPAPVEETVTPNIVVPPKPKGKRFISTRILLYHPFAHVHIPTGPPGVILEEPDSWLESQIERGLVKEI